MALISELNKVTADALTFPLPTVTMYSRVLREAGLLSKKGRGRGAAHATSRDGARLLIALLVTPSPSQAAECVKDFGALVCSDGVAYEGSAFTPEIAYELPKRHTFEQMVASIIDGFSHERFAKCIEQEIGRQKNPLLRAPPRITVGVLDTAMAAGIEIGSNHFRYSFGEMVDCPAGQPLKRAFAKFERAVSKYRRGIDSRRSVDTGPLRKIAAVINGREIDIGWPSHSEIGE
jgi:hypothetical protein